MHVPGVVALAAGDAHVVVVDPGDDPRGPHLVEPGEGVVEVDHGPSVGRRSRTGGGVSGPGGRSDGVTGATSVGAPCRSCTSTVGTVTNWMSGSTTRRPPSTTCARARPRGAERTLLIGDHPADPDFELTEAGLHEGAVVRFGPPRAVDRGPPLPPAPVLGRRPPASWWWSTGSTPAGASHWCRGPWSSAGRPGATSCCATARCPGATPASPTVPDGEFTIEDYRSHNGTWVAGEAVLDPVPLAEGMPCGWAPRPRGAEAMRDDDRPVAVDPAAPHHRGRHHPVQPAAPARPSRRRRAAGAPAPRSARAGAVLAARLLGAPGAGRAACTPPPSRRRCSCSPA